MTRARSLRSHRRGDIKVDPQFALDNCLNCGQQLLSVCSTENEDSIGPGVVAFESFVKNAKTQVFLKDAVKEIYSVLYATDLEADLQNCALCVDCSLVFAQLFGLFQTFEARRKSEGVLDVAVTKGIQLASEFVRSTNGSARPPGTEEGVLEDDFLSEFEKFAGGPSNDKKNCDDMEVDTDINELVDVITVRSIPSPEEQIVDDSQQADVEDDANWASDLDNEGPCTPGSAEDSNVEEADSVPEIAAKYQTCESNPDPGSPHNATKPQRSSSHKFGEPASRKSRRIDAKTKVETNINSTKAETKEEAVESDYATTSSNSSSDDSDTDNNNGPPVTLPTRRKRGRGSKSYSRKNVTYKCTDCPEVFNATAELADHRKNAHNTLDIFKCHICFKNFHVGFYLTAHLLRHEKAAAKAPDEEKIFKCVDCGERYSSAAEFGRHRISVHGAVKNTYVCHICLFDCKHQTLLKPHIIRHVSTEQHRCSECPKVYKVSSDLKAHMRKKHKITFRKNHNLTSADPSIKVIIKCKKCVAEFDSQEKFLEHSTTEHGDELFPCEICQKVFLRKDKLNSHILTHTKPEIKCQFCERNFHTHQGRRYHEEHVHQEYSTESTQVFCDPPSQVPKAAGAFQCTECHLTFDTDTELSVHVDCRHKTYEFKCDDCEKSYMTKDRLRCHQRQAHGQVKCLKCHEIVKGGQMAAHLAEAHGRPKPTPSRVRRPRQQKEHNVSYPCIDCPEIFPTLKQFRQHRLTHNVSAKDIFKCSICHKVSTSDHFPVHLEKHNESTDWPCAHCSMRFLQRTHRNEHQTQVHGPQPNDDPEGMLPLPPASTLQLLSGEQVQSDVRKMGYSKSPVLLSFKCLECDQEFNRSLSLGNHRAIVHGCTGEDRFQCHCCLKFSPSATALHLHVRRHYGGKDNLCEVCGKGFRMPDDLKQHYRLNHTEEEQKQLREKWKKWRMKKAAERRSGKEGQ